MVAWTTPPGLAALPAVHPLSWYGADRPPALSGWAGITMRQVALLDDTVLDDTVAGGEAGVVAAGGGLGEDPRDDWLMWVPLPPDRARTMPRVRPSAMGTPTGAANRAARRSRERRLAGGCPLSNSHPPPLVLAYPGNSP